MNEIAANDIHPVTRLLIIAIMIIIPVLVVILQRLPALRAALKKEGDQSDAASGSKPFSLAEGSDVLICSQCGSPAPAGFSFCGFCGYPLKGET